MSTSGPGSWIPLRDQGGDIDDHEAQRIIPQDTSKGGAHMTRINEQIHIQAPRSAVWKALAAFDRISDWEPGYVSSEYATDQREGVGTSRHAQIKTPFGARHVLHVVTRWEPGVELSWEARDADVPLVDTAENIARLTTSGDTTIVDDELTYTLKYGPLGRVMDRLVMRKQMKGALTGFLQSLKEHVEAGIGDSGDAASTHIEGSG